MSGGPQVYRDGGLVDASPGEAAAIAAIQAAAAAPAVPQVVTNYQARAVLIDRGLFDRADADLRAADMSVTANRIALQAWDYANVFERGSPIIAAMAASLGLAPADVDALFTAAAAVT